jgi:excisionase family DNA binding protein
MLTVTDAAAALRTSRRAVRALIREGQITAFRLTPRARQWLITPEALDDFIHTREEEEKTCPSRKISAPANGPAAGWPMSVTAEQVSTELGALLTPRKTPKPGPRHAGKKAWIDSWADAVGTCSEKP